jgi:hypothetical protein
VFLAIAFYGTGYYFGPHLTLYNVQVRPLPDAFDAILRAVELPPDAQLYIVAPVPPVTQRHADEMMGFLADGRALKIVATHEFTAGYLAALPRDVPQAFFLASGDAAALRALLDTFGSVQPRLSPYHQELPPGKAMLLYYYDTVGS